MSGVGDALHYLAQMTAGLAACQDADARSCTASVSSNQCGPRGNSEAQRDGDLSTEKQAGGRGRGRRTGDPVAPSCNRTLTMSTG